ncbi:hypothetical protein OPT61_g5267 [Boeremia exigua]|uniref:Uncharacterized protein n=1 Tax=Boeremia exigua TaxID=749465 RepID=A0ACC2IB10_9PLEO|nr:hypothetical protein OPT61_g5267 [Boeremia exigua]
MSTSLEAPSERLQSEHAQRGDSRECGAHVMSAGWSMKRRDEPHSAKVQSLDKRAGCTTGVVSDVDAIVNDRTAATCGVSDALSAKPPWERSSSVTPSWLNSPTATRIEFNHHVSLAVGFIVPAPWAGRDAATQVDLYSELKQLLRYNTPRIQVSGFEGVECRRHGTRNVVHIAGQAGSNYAPSMRTVGGRLDAFVPATLDRWQSTSLAASGAKPSVRISFDPVHHMEGFSIHIVALQGYYLC